MNLTEHFTLDELVLSETAVRRGIDNTPDADVLANLQMLAAGLEKVRAILGSPINVSSGYRCPKLNTAIGGSRTSAHMLGLACDFTSPAFGSPHDICVALEHELSYIGQVDQLIAEGRWVHIAFSDTPRYQILSAYFDSAGHATYTKGLGRA